MCMKYKGILITIVSFLILLSVFGLYATYSFNHNSLNRALVGQVEEDKYPDWDNWNGSEKDSELEYDIVSKSGLYLSKIYLIERANHYQIRFRIGCIIPFMHEELLRDTCWILEYSEGRSYTDNMVVYAEQIAGLNCLNVTLVLDEEFADLSGEELNITAVCSKEGNAQTDVENSYAHCKAKILFP